MKAESKARKEMEQLVQELCEEIHPLTMADMARLREEIRVTKMRTGIKKPHAGAFFVQKKYADNYAGFCIMSVKPFVMIGRMSS
jgi:hypothetical protein